MSMQNANAILGKVFQWEPGQEIEVKLKRGTEEVIIKTTLVQSYTMGESLGAIEEATEAQVKLRNAWLKG